MRQNEKGLQTVVTQSYIVDNDRRFRNAIARAAEVVKDLRIPFTLILNDFYKSEKAIFQLKSAGQYPPFVNHTKDDKSPYQKRKLAKWGFDYPLLVASGRLSASLLSKDAPGAVAAIGPTELVFGTTVPYGIYHQSDEPRSRVPLRKFLFIGPEAPQFATSEQTGRPTRWMNILNDYALKKMKQSGAFV
jgi:phage gpG-like protein